MGEPAAVRDEIARWFAAQVPASWFEGPIRVAADRDEVLVLGRLPAPPLPAGTVEASVAAACLGVIESFREDTRDHRTRIAHEAEHRFAPRKVGWGATCGDVERLFTTLSLPVMTRLRMPERAVLDTLVDASVARSRSEALAWCVRLVGANEGSWISDLQDALVHVEKVRAGGPASKPGVAG